MNNTISRIAFFLLLSATLNVSPVFAGEPIAHILICCRSNNQGATFLVNGVWNPAHDYTDINVTRSILQHIKNAGINTC